MGEVPEGLGFPGLGGAQAHALLQLIEKKGCPMCVGWSMSLTMGGVSDPIRSLSRGT